MTEQSVVRVVVADDQRLVRTGFRVILGETPGIEVVGEAADGVEAVELATALHPDVVLMDIRMPRLDGIQAARAVVARTDSRVLILTTFDSDEYVYEALAAGASGFLLKDVPARAPGRRDPLGGARRRPHRPVGDASADRTLHPGAAARPGVGDRGTGPAERAHRSASSTCCG